MKKVLFVTTIGVAWGGSEELWSQAATRLVKQGYQVEASLGWYGSMHPKVQKLKDAGVRLKFRKNRLRETLTLGLEKLGLSAYRKLVLNAYEKHVNEAGPDIVVFSQATCFGAYRLMLYCQRKGIAYCSVSQLNTEFDWPTDSNVEQVAEAFHSAKAAFFVSKGNLELFQLQIAESLANASVIPNAYNLEELTELAWPKEECMKIAHVARLDFSHKGTDILLRCFAEEQWAERNFVLNLYGKGNSGLATKLAAYCGTHKVQFKGEEAEVAAIWKENHLLVLPSRYEGMPLSLIEAMYCGRPAVVTDVAGHGELIEEGVNGFIAEAPTQKLFSQALERAWDRKMDWSDMGAKTKSCIQDLYTADPVKVFIEKLLKAVKL